MKKQHDLRSGSLVIDWQEQHLEIKDATGQHTVPLDLPLHVTMIGYPDLEEKDLLAGALAPYMERGYIIVKIAYSCDNPHE